MLFNQYYFKIVVFLFLFEPIFIYIFVLKELTKALSYL